MPEESASLRSLLEKRHKLLGVISVELAAGCDALRRLDLDAIHLHVFHLELLCGQARAIERQIRALLPLQHDRQTREAESDPAASIAELIRANAAAQSEVQRKNNVFAGALSGTRKTFGALALVFAMQNATYGPPPSNAAALTKSAGS
ncbi:MAG: hypothetical protein WCB14_01110 [Candidatus Acidiferrales bacterium]